MSRIRTPKDIYNIIEIFLLGAICGIPYSILYTALAAWLTESRVDITIITSFVLARAPYSLKFLWSPFIDSYKLPILARLGRRKSWMMLTSAMLAVIMFLMHDVDPRVSVGRLYILSILFGFTSASFDISWDAYRIEKFPKESQAIPAAIAVFGFRCGSIVIAAGTLYLAHHFGWQETFFILSLFFIASTLFIFTLKERPLMLIDIDQLTFKDIVISPFLDFFKRDYSVLIILAVVLYKLGESMLSVIGMPFYLELGFSMIEIANVVKICGFIFSTLGSLAGGYVMIKFGNLRGLIICGLAQIVTNLSFIWLLEAGPNVNALFVVISAENFTGSMGGAALIGYISYLCNQRYTATQYALLSSAGSIMSNTLTSQSGNLINWLGWSNFFVFTVILSFPGIILFTYLYKKTKPNSLKLNKI